MLAVLDTEGRDQTPPAQTAIVDRMLACRFEMKYVIDEIKAAGIVRYIRPFLQMDRYSKLQRRGMYPIVSLYLDSPELRLCRESLTGQKNRFKLRIRSYTDEPEYPRFFEIKRRINQVIIKSRRRWPTPTCRSAPGPVAAAEGLLDGSERLESVPALYGLDSRRPDGSDPLSEAGFRKLGGGGRGAGDVRPGDLLQGDRRASSAAGWLRLASPMV